MRVRTLVAVVVLAVIALTIVGVVAGPADVTPTPSPARSPALTRTPPPPSATPTEAASALAPSVALQSPGTPMSVTDLLTTLKVAPEHRVGYDRDLFPHWIDADGDGCNTRYEVLLDEAVVAPTISGSCDLTGGTWLSPYDGVTLNGASQVQIDHLVPLAEAWYSGAFAWTTERRQALANDLGVPWTLVGVSGKTNEAKGSSDPGVLVAAPTGRGLPVPRQLGGGQGPLGPDDRHRREGGADRPARRLPRYQRSRSRSPPHDTVRGADPRIRAGRSGPGQTRLPHPDRSIGAGALVHLGLIRTGVQPHRDDHRDEDREVVEQVELRAGDVLLQDARGDR